MGDDDAGQWEGDDGPTRITHPFEPGAMFAGRFRIEQELAGGGMGTVYRALDLRAERIVALKVLKKDRHPDEEVRQRFLREAEILVSMDHPGIVRIRGFGHAPDGTLWLAMELLEGETLLDKVRREGPQDPAKLVPIVRAVCEALEAAHSRGIVHRDLKPENIFLPAGGEPRVKILDFGLSLIAGGAKLTRTGTILGTPRYMAPEQIRSARSADARVDIYALGLIIYEALAGSSPFTASDHGQLLGAILAGRKRPLSEVRPDLGPAIETVIEHASMPDPADRYATVADLAEAFAAATRMPSSRPPPPASQRPPASPLSPLRRPSFSTPPPPAPAEASSRGSRLALVVVAGVVALAAVAVLAWAAVSLFAR